MRKFQAYEACSSTSPDYDSKSGFMNKKKNAKKTNRYLKANNQADDSKAIDQAEDSKVNDQAPAKVGGVVSCGSCEQQFDEEEESAVGEDDLGDDVAGLV